jgi:hypothetical protein
MRELQLTQQRCVEQIAKGAQHIQRRQLERADLEERLQQLGEKARAVTEPATPKAEVEPGEPFGPLDDVGRNLEGLINEVAQVCDLAGQQDWQDLARDTQSLREQLQALKNRVQLARRKLAQDAPS